MSTNHGGIFTGGPVSAKREGRARKKSYKDMEQYKLDDFRADHPGLVFPWYESLSQAAAEKVRRQLAAKLGIADPSDGISLVKVLESKAALLEAINANNDSFDLSNAFKKAGISPPEVILLNWYRFDAIDRMRFEDVRRHFWDIWYPAADDLDLFDENLTWILMLMHDGYVKSLKP